MNRYKFDDGIDEKGKQKHIHLLDGKPLKGNTTVLKELAKTLTYWASGLAMAEFGWVKELRPWDKPKPTKEMVEANKLERLAKAGEALEMVKTLTVEEYLSKLDKGYKAHAVKLDKSADEGTDMHALLENYCKLMISDQDGVPMLMNGYEHPSVKIFAEWAVKNLSKFIASEGCGYNEELWIGGILDILAEDKEGRLLILDFKSAKEVYPSHFFQCGACDLEISHSGVLDKEGNLIYDLKGRKIDYYAVLPFGSSEPGPQLCFDVDAMKEGFKATLTINKIINPVK